MKKVVNVEIRVGPRDSVEACIRRFTKKVKKSGILDDYIERMHIRPKKTKRKKKK